MIGVGLDGGNANDFGHMWDGWGMGWAGGWMMLVWILLLGLIVGGIVVLTRRDRGHEHGTQPPARDVLDLRYARGEISQDEYLNARLVLDDGQPPD